MLLALLTGDNFRMKMFLKLAAVTAIAFSANAANAATCIGNCGTQAPNGSVTAPPGGTNFDYVSTNGGVTGAGQVAGVAGTNGSEFTSDVFSAAAGDLLSFYFNYITSDGTGTFTDYAFAQLLSSTGTSLGYLFTARTTPSGNTSPGFGLGTLNISTLTPGTTAIQPGTTWSALGSSSGQCFGAGCGNTGWIQSTYNIKDAGSYKIKFGVTNVGDTGFDSGLAYSGLKVAGVPVGAVPEPGTWLMMLLGFGLMGGALRSRQKKNFSGQLAF